MDFVAKPDHFANNDNGWWFDGIRSTHNIGQSSRAAILNEIGTSRNNRHWSRRGATGREKLSDDAFEMRQAHQYNEGSTRLDECTGCLPLWRLQTMRLAAARDHHEGVRLISISHGDSR